MDRSRSTISVTEQGVIVNKREPIPKSVRFEVFKRARFRCQYCGARQTDGDVTLHVDHVIPVSEGGTNDIQNLVAACASCNLGKGATRLDTAAMSAVLHASSDTHDDDVDDILDQWCELSQCETAGTDTSALREQLRTLISEYGKGEVMESVRVAGKRYIKYDLAGEPWLASVESGWDCIEKICGERRTQRTMQIDYICRILQNRFRGTGLDLTPFARTVVRDATARGWEMGAIARLVRGSGSWSEVCRGLATESGAQDSHPPLSITPTTSKSLLDLCSNSHASPPQIRDLVLRGANVDEADRDGLRPLHRAVDAHCNPDVLTTLVEAGASLELLDDNGETPLHRAAWMGQSVLVRTLVDLGSNVDVKDSLGHTPLFQASYCLTYRGNRLRSRCVDVLAALIAGGADINVECDGDTALCALVRNEAVSEADLLVSAGADVNKCADGGETPLHIAASNSSGTMVAGLIRAGANVNAVTDNPEWWGVGRTPLHCAALDASSCEILELLLRAGAVVNHPDSEGDTPLHIAAGNKAPIATQVLLSYGADVHACSVRGETPLHVASRNRVTAIMRMLLAAGGHLHAQDKEGKTPLHEAACSNDNPDGVAVLCGSGADVKAGDDDGWVALHYAAWNNTNPRVLLALLEAGTDVGTVDNAGLTALHCAACGNPNPEVLVTLLAEGANLSAVDSGKGTPLHHAASANPEPQVLVTLLEAGADVFAVDEHGHTAVDYARQNRGLRDTDALRRLEDLCH